MQRASKLFSDEQKQAVNTAIAEAESQTSAEIVPVVSTASGRYDRPEDIVGLWLGALALAVVWFVVPQHSDAVGTWGGTSPLIKLIYMLLALAGGFFIGAVVASRVGPLRWLFTPSKQMRDEVAGRACQAFFDSTIHHTAGGTGVLIYVSLYERMAAVLADQSILDKLGPDALEELRDKLTADLRDSEPTEALCQALRDAGQRLAEVLPRAEDDVNELPDHLVIVDA